MKKKALIIVAVIALVAILGVCLVACNASSVSKSLDKKGYTVVTLNEDASGLIASTAYTLLKNNSSFEEGIFATKSSDSVGVVWFKDTDAAEEFEANISKVSKKTARLSKVVYFGTEQGVKDAK